jgi:hypothetical protein
MSDVPIVLVACLNLPPWVRYLPGFIVLLGVIPGPRCNNFQTFLKFIAQQFDSVFINALSCYDRNLQKRVRSLQQTVYVVLIVVALHFDCSIFGFIQIVLNRACQIESKSYLLMWVNDTRAEPHVTMSTQPPALDCACTVCDVTGWQLPALESTLYFCGIRCLAEFGGAETKLLRQEWRASMAGVPWVQSMNQQAFQYRDEAFRRAAGEASDCARGVSAAALKRAVRAGGYYGTGRYDVLGVRCVSCLSVSA